jgi:hypothetical protein
MIIRVKFGIETEHELSEDLKLKSWVNNGKKPINLKFNIKFYIIPLIKIFFL